MSNHNPDAIRFDELYSNATEHVDNPDDRMPRWKARRAAIVLYREFTAEGYDTTPLID